MSHTQTAVVIIGLILFAIAVTDLVVRIELWRAEQKRKRILGRFQ